MIYRFELRRQLPSALVWTAVLCAVLWLMIYGFYPIFLESRSIMEEFLQAFPPEVMAAMGFNLDDIFRFESFSCMVYLYEGVLGAIMISSASIAVFAREKNNKCTDFLLTKPKTRAELFGKKLLCCLTLVGISGVSYMLLFLLGAWHFSGGGMPSKEMLLCVFCLPLTQLVFLSIGIFLAVFLRKIRSATGLGCGIGIFAFLLAALYSLTEKDAMKFISPLYYFSPNAVMDTGGYDRSCVITALVLMAGLTAASFWKYTREDAI